MSVSVTAAVLIGLLAASTLAHSGVNTLEDTYTCQNGVFQYAESIPTEVYLNTNTTTTQAWLSLLNNAKRTIDIAAYYISLTGGDIDGQLIYDAILAAANRGIRVRVAINIPSSSQPDTDLVNLLKASSNIEAQWVNMTQLVGAGIIHTKFFAVDSNALYVGSANLDWRSLTQVKELGVVVTNCPLLAVDLERTFDIYWIAGQIKQLPEYWPEYTHTPYNIHTPASVTLNNTATSVYLTGSPAQFCAPERTQDIDSIVAIMADAEDSICIEVMDYEPLVVYQYPQYFWPVIDNAIRSAAFRGVQVRMLIADWSHSSPVMFPYLDSLDVLPNIEVRVMVIPPVQPVVPYTRVNHAKFMVTEQTAFVSTSNWVGDYFISTAGVSFVTDYEAAIDNLQGVFDRDWESNYTTTLPPFTPNRR